MMKTQIGLGVLSIPSVFDTLGMIPGIIVLLAIAIITTWSDYVVGVFKLNHPEVYGIDDVGKMIFGKPGQIIFGGAFVLYWVFVAGSGMLSLSIALNALSTHGACTAIFVAVAAISGWLLASIQTLDRVSWIAWVGLAGILSSIFALTVAAGVQDRPSAAPDSTAPFISDFKIVSDNSWAAAISACSSLVFAYAGTPAFFSIVSEMRDPKQYTRSLIICQTTVTVTYVVIGIVVYYFCGSYVASPALGSAGVTMKKVCYGLALPGLLATVMLTSHVRRLPRLIDWRMTDETDFPVAARQILFRSHYAWISALDQEYCQALGSLARLHCCLYYRILHRRERHSGLWGSCVAHWSSPWHSYVLPTYGIYVALRQLERW